MYLKNIEVQGFKSFAQKINFEFHNGITGIVGPNGSGKSNVGDAVRWVLGEQSAKQLRGGNMQDVIFSGTELRKPLSFASVAITLDNSDHKLPVDFEEVTVTRRLYRSGESEYRINGSSCRLKDINEMFYDTGIGKEGYSIIGQGQIDKILSGKPEDRRELFDEAAGIVKFKRRKNTTLKKLEEEQQNLVRVTDILSELTKQLEPLERQSETAKIYLAKRESLKELDVNMFLLEYEHTGKLIRELEEKTRIAENQLQEAKDAHSRTKDEYERLEKSLEELNQRMDALREESRDRAIRKQQLSGEINVLHEQILAGEQNDSHYRSRLLAIQEDTEKKSADREELEEQRADLQAKLREVSRELSDEQEKLDNIQSNIEECTQAVEDGKNEIIEILNSRANTKGKAQRFDAMMEQLDIRKAGISQRMLSLKTQEEEQQSAITQAKKEYDTITESIQAIREEGSNLTKEIKAIQETLKQQNTELEESQRAYHREASRLESLRNITERYDGYGNSIRRVMEQKSRNAGILGVVSDLIQVDKKYETAIETALGGNIQNIVTEDEETAKQMISYLKQNRYGRATFLPLTSVDGKGNFKNTDALKEPGVIGLANTLVKTEEKYAGVTAYLLGRVIVTENIDYAIKLAKKNRYSLHIVTLEGEYLSPGGSMTGGAFKNSSNLLARNREIEELEKNVKDLDKQIAELKNRLEDIKTAQSLLAEDVESNKASLQEAYIAQNTAKMNVERAMEQKNESENVFAGLQMENREIESQLREIAENKDKIAEELQSAKEREAQIEEESAGFQKILDENAGREEEAQKAVSDVQLKEAGVRQKLEFVLQNLERVNGEIRRYEEEREGFVTEAKEAKADAEKKRHDIEEIKKTILASKDNSEQLEQALKEHTARREEMSSEYKGFFQKREDISKKISDLDKEIFRLNSQREKLEEAHEYQNNYMWEEYELTLHAAMELRNEEYTDLAAMKKMIASIKDEIRKLGDVNVNAIEDYKEISERYGFLKTQHDDLVEAEKTLVGIIEELDTGMRKQFLEKFAEIQTEFDKVFKELFGGGKGTLELVEDEDILECGIRIIAQPPGKKLQNMMQMSGGEKSLTAISLLFAIQNLKPSPFCLLDEIEAALDDSNVGRFAKYLHKLTKSTQFIVITHRRGTMAAADRLYGITMQEKGVSTLVSVNLIEGDLDK